MKVRPVYVLLVVLILLGLIGIVCFGGKSVCDVAPSTECVKPTITRSAR